MMEKKQIRIDYERAMSAEHATPNGNGEEISSLRFDIGQIICFSKQIYLQLTLSNREPGVLLGR